MLLKNWKEILIKAWSVRLSLLSAFFGGIEVLLSITDFGMPQGVFASLSFLFAVLTPISRLLAQKDLKDE